MFVIILIVLIILISLIIKYTYLEFELKNINLRIRNNEVTYKVKIIIKLRVFGILTFFKKTINDIHLKNKVTNIQNISKRMYKRREKIKVDKYVNIKKINLNVNIGLESAELTAILVGIISLLISFYLGKNNTRINQKDCCWKVVPIYGNKNYLNLSLNCILSMNLAHIILKKKGERNVRISNRRPYAYNNE